VYKVVVFGLCRSSVRPIRAQQTRHLTNGGHPRLLQEEELRKNVDYLQSLDLRTEEELRSGLPPPQQSVAAIDHVRTEDGFQCPGTGYRYLTADYRKMREHQPKQHGVRAASHGMPAML
jgi:hypothetical protein